MIQNSKNALSPLPTTSISQESTASRPAADDTAGEMRETVANLVVTHVTPDR